MSREPKISTSWTSWWQEDLPCVFNRAQAATNAAFLADQLGTRWITRGVDAPPGTARHPLLTLWYTRGGTAFLTLNALAEDLRQLLLIPGLDTLLHDLKQAKLYEPTLHVVRCAALLTRSGEAQVVEFYPQTKESLPDFSLRVGITDIPVEAKLLMSSDVQEVFNAWALKIVDALFALPEGILRQPCWLQVIARNARDLPDPDEVSTLVAKLQMPPEGMEILAKFAKVVFLVRASPTPSLKRDLSTLACPTVSVLGPRSTDETLRVYDRCKKASKQLQAIGKKTRKGLLALGGDISSHPRYMAGLIQQRLANGWYSGIGAVLMTTWHTCFEPPCRTILERVAVIPPPAGSELERLRKMKWTPRGELEPLFGPKDDPSKVPAYFCSEVRAPDGLKPGYGVCLPDIRELPADILS